MVLKSIILISAYILPFVALNIFLPSYGVSLILWAIMGFALAGIGMSVMHDANHGVSCCCRVNLKNRLICSPPLCFFSVQFAGRFVRRLKREAPSAKD